MSSAARKIDYSQSKANEDFTANLEDGSTFRALYTELTASTTPGRGDVWVIRAYDRNNIYARTFTITFQKDKLEGDAVITDDDTAGHASLIYNDYENPQNPTLQKARTGTLQYTLDVGNQHFTGTFTANIDKADDSGTYESNGAFDTVLS